MCDWPVTGREHLHSRPTSERLPFRATDLQKGYAQIHPPHSSDNGGRPKRGTARLARLACCRLRSISASAVFSGRSCVPHVAANMFGAANHLHARWLQLVERGGSNNNRPAAGNGRVLECIEAAAAPQACRTVAAANVVASTLLRCSRPPPNRALVIGPLCFRSLRFLGLCH